MKGEGVRASNGAPKNLSGGKVTLTIHGIKTNELVRLCGGMLKLGSGHEMYHLKMAPNIQQVQFGQSH